MVARSRGQMRVGEDRHMQGDVTIEGNERVVESEAGRGGRRIDRDGRPVASQGDDA